MNTTVEKVVSDAMDLSPTARAFVAEKLIESLDVEPDASLSPKWREEIRKRCEAMDRGEAELRDGAAVFARAYAALE